MKKLSSQFPNCWDCDMGKDPAFLFYPGDWDGGTKLFTREQKGAYMDLLVAQFNCGHMTSQEVAHILGQDYDKMWDSRLKAKFKIDDQGRFYNEKLENEQIRRKNFTDSRKQNLSGKNQYSHMDGHTTTRMETETETRTKDINEYDFESLWIRYPKPLGKKQALRHFLASVKTDEDWKNINSALNNYLKTENVVKGNVQYIKHGSTWFNNWQDYISVRGLQKSEPVSGLSIQMSAK
jgi:hypothetical protein